MKARVGCEKELHDYLITQFKEVGNEGFQATKFSKFKKYIYACTLYRRNREAQFFPPFVTLYL